MEWDQRQGTCGGKSHDLTITSDKLDILTERCSVQCCLDGIHICILVCEAKFDLLIILDSSSSVRCQGFHDLKRFLVALLDSVLVGVDYVQVLSSQSFDKTVEAIYEG